MATPVIVSYDGTTNDDDALALGRMLAVGGATLSLAYVRHSREYDPRREEIGVYDADRRLELGAIWLEDPEIERHVVIDPSTGAGLAQLAATEGARLILFGSDYRTPPGRVEPGGAAQGLLEGSPVAIGVAAAGLRARGDEKIQTISVAGDSNGAAHASAEALAQALGARDPRGQRRRRPDPGRLSEQWARGQDRPRRVHAGAAGLGARLGHRAAARRDALVLSGALAGPDGGRWRPPVHVRASVSRC